MGQVGLCTLFLTAGLAGPYKGRGAQSSRSETLKHQRERHYPERTRKQKPKEKNKHKHGKQTHARWVTGPEIMFDKKCLTTRHVGHKQKENNFYIINADLSTFSIKDNLSVFWTVNLCQLQICTGDYTTWLSKLSLSLLRAGITGRRASAYACM